MFFKSDADTAPQTPLLVTLYNKDSAKFWLNLSEDQLGEAIEKSRTYSKQRKEAEEECIGIVVLIKIVIF